MSNEKKTMETEGNITVLSAKELQVKLLDDITVGTKIPDALTGEKKNLALFNSVKNSVPNPILVNRVVSVNSLLRLNYKDYLIMSHILTMKDTEQLTYSQIVSKIFPKIEPKKASNEGMTVEYRNLVGKISDRDIEKAVIMLVALGCKLHLTYNKNGACSVRHEEAKISLIKPSLFIPVETTDQITKEIKKGRQTVALKNEARLAILNMFNAVSYDIGMSTLKIELSRLNQTAEKIEESTDKKQNLA